MRRTWHAVPSSMAIFARLPGKKKYFINGRLWNSSCYLPSNPIRSVNPPLAFLLVNVRMAQIVE